VATSSDRGVASVDDFEGEILFREALQNFISSTFRHRSLSALLRQDAELAETLHAYFETSLDVAACASRMGLHKNTVYYRISKASRATGLDFGNPRDSLVALLHIQEWAGTSREQSGRK
jgi:DNA-binding PucR family transcriptional regulator